MSEPATWMVGLSHYDDEEGPRATVALGLGYGPRIDFAPKAARMVARQLLLCADDAEKFNEAQEGAETPQELAIDTAEHGLNPKDLK